MKTRLSHYNYVTTLPENSNNHPYAKLAVVFDTRRKEFFTANTCDVHERLAPWDGGADSHYTTDEVRERLLMMHLGGML